MSNLVATEFSSVPDEELIEETATPNRAITAGMDKYVDSSCTLEKQVPSDSSEDILPIDSLYFSEGNDLVFKPQINGNGSSSSGDTGEATARKEIIYYTVQNGDTISTISRRFGLTVNTILWANNLSAFSVIRIGDRLAILPYSGVLYTVKKGDTLARISQTYGIELEKILSCNSLGNSLSVGEKIIIPGAKKISDVVAVRKTSNTNYTGISIIKDLIKSPVAKVTGNKMAWPAGGYRISQYFSWRHPGIDIANKIGTPIYAADDGVVIISQGGYNGGYGNTIVIDHGGGKKTRYGHASKLFVKVGERVEKGENIAAMGSTGRSTGSHLHFEVIISGAKYNPLSYVK
ncbi:MAG: peptidoglycan DD-metalloendopeptidase family protein [Patescibacteria group bacterium]